MDYYLSPDTHQKVFKNLKTLMLSRIIILTLLLAITFIFQLSEEKYFFLPMTNQFYYFVILLYMASIIYTFLLKRIKNLHRFAFFQIIIDHFFITGLVYFTGGKESYFPIVYFFSIIGGSIIFHRRGALFFASLSSLLYGLLLMLQLYNFIKPLGQTSLFEASQIFYSLILYMLSFYVVGLLSGTISEELRRKKRELLQKQVDYNQLETFNRNIIQSLDSGLLTIDLNGRINFLNRTAMKIINRSEEELKGSSIYELFPKIDKMIEEIKRKSPNNLLDYQDYQRSETVLTDKDGKKTYLGFSISPLTGPEGSLIGHTLIFQDITKFKEMEEQMKRFDKMAAIGSLAAGIAHEIRNPLASLSGSIQLLKSELTLDQSQEHLMEITLRESERLNALINDFLLFASPPQTNRILYSIGKILDETIELFIHSPSFRDGIQITRIGLKEDLEIMIDPDQIKQVFWNLLINASQSMSNGGRILVHIEKEKGTYARNLHMKDRRPREWIKISITDSGSGISPQDKEKIFEPFFTTKEGGTGLGLSIVHKIVENHHGMIKVESEQEKGSTFSILLPI